MSPRKSRVGGDPKRKGAAVVEFALVAPVFILFVLGIVEFGRGMMVQQAMINATREGAREAALPEATKSSVKDVVTDFLEIMQIEVEANQITVTPDPATAFSNEQITVSVQVPYNDVAWVPGSYLRNLSFNASTKMRSERLE